MKDSTYESLIGRAGETVRNINDKSMLHFYLLHEIIVANTFYQYKEIHKYVKDLKKRNE